MSDDPFVDGVTETTAYATVFRRKGDDAVGADPIAEGVISGVCVERLGPRPESPSPPVVYLTFYEESGGFGIHLAVERGKALELAERIREAAEALPHVRTSDA